MPKVGIIGADAEAKLVAKRLRDRKGTPFFLFERFPASSTSSISYSGRLNGYSDNASLGEIDSLLLRTYAGLAVPMSVAIPTPRRWKQIYQNYREYLHTEFEKLSYRYSLIRILEKTKLVVNSIDCLSYHWQKPFQYFILSSNGIPVPDFVVGNDPDELREFIREKPHCQVAYKSTSGTGDVRRIDLEYFERRKGALKYEPILVQEIIEGTNLRVYVLGERIIAAGKITHRGFDSGLDVTSITRIRLSRDIQRIVLAAARTLNMKFSGIDVIRDDASGKFYVLECNDQAGFVLFERLTHVPISRLLADYLLGYHR
jgi:glutathione synthase/RimK-type ligase-like ATP-grasp enzyme